MSAINNIMKGNTKATEAGAADSKVSSPANVDMTDQSNRSTLHDSLVYDAIIDCNPSYWTTQEVNKKKKEFDDDCDYVVSSEEMIKTDTNPSYVPILVGSNILEDNPSYQAI